jgi:autotransporter family porin
LQQSGNGSPAAPRGFAASIEGGYPIVLTAWLTFEPQIQGIWQRTSFDDTLDPFSTITFDRSNVFTGRAGALLRGAFGSSGAVWQPYLKGNVWWGSNGFDTVRFDADPIQTGRNDGRADLSRESRTPITPKP